jgi:hypothetical protein
MIAQCLYELSGGHIKAKLRERNRRCYYFVMDLREIIQQLTHERARIDAALTALEGLTSGSSTGHRRPAPSTNGIGKKRRRLSAAARKAIGDAQRKRWAKQKRLAKA